MQWIPIFAFTISGLLAALAGLVLAAYIGYIDQWLGGGYDLDSIAAAAIGGVRLAPHVSPSKTWSGACGGALGALACGVALVYVAGNTALLPAAGVALVLSVASQAGDLFESAVKRQFGVKDASHVIPGHGGLMDRLDGFIAASGAAALVGIIRGGLDAAARGLLLWS